MAAAVVVRLAEPDDAALVSSILNEAASWLESRGMPLWRHDELDLALVVNDVIAGLFWIADVSGEPAGVMRLQHSDPDFWPDVPQGESAFLHRIAVRRQFAGGAISAALLRFACEHARALGLKYVRLDCEASRPALKKIYEQFGFTYRNDRQVGPYLVSRYELAVGENRPAAVALRPYGD